MKPLHDTSRVLRLILCLSLIGGTACVSVGNRTPAQQAADQEAYVAQRTARIESLQRDSARGDLSATTGLGFEYINGGISISQDVPKGVAMLEQAAAKHYAPAEYGLGWMLINGRNAYGGRQIQPALVPPQPERGVMLLKQSSTVACKLHSVTAYGNQMVNVAYEISALYSGSRFVLKDKEQADLWLARSILYCAYPGEYSIRNTFLNVRAVTPETQIETMAWLMLMPPSTVGSTLQASMTAQDVQAATRRMETLRAAVLASEAQYPAPGKP